MCIERSVLNIEKAVEKNVSRKVLYRKKKVCGREQLCVKTPGKTTNRCQKVTRVKLYRKKVCCIENSV